jgi:hypothetical protein
MTEQDDSSGESWRGMLTEPDITRVKRAFDVDPDLEQDLEAMLEGLSPKRRALFLRRFAANLPEAETPQSALLPALADIMRTVLAEEGGKATRSRGTPPEETEP